MTTDPNWLKSITESYTQEVSESARNLQEEAENLYNLIETIQTALNVDLTEAQVDALINVFEMDDIKGKLLGVTDLQSKMRDDDPKTISKYGGKGPYAASIARGRLGNLGARLARRLKAQGTGIEPSEVLPKRLSKMGDDEPAGIESEVKSKGDTVHYHPTDGQVVTAGTLGARRDATKTLRMNSPEGIARNKPSPITGKKAISPLGHIDPGTLAKAAIGNATSGDYQNLRATRRK